MPEEYKTNTKLPEIDALRGIAIIMVVCQHTKSYWWLRDHPVLFNNCWQAVNLFFLLSGFSLALPYLNRKRNLNNQTEIWNFYKKRFQRLIPLMLISTTIGVYFCSHFENDAFWDYFYTVTTLNTFTEKYFFPKVNDVLWSLSIEVWFSICFVFIIYCFRKKPYFTAGVIFLIALGVRIYSINACVDYKILNYIKDSLFARLDDFLLGMIVCYWIINTSVLQKIKPNIFISLLLLVLIYLLSKNNFEIWYYNRVLAKNQGYYLAFMNNYTHVVLLLLLLFYFTMNKWLSFIFKNYVLRMLGRMSFSIYIWHSFLVELFDQKIGNTESSDSILLAKFWILTLIISILTYRYIEFGHVNSWKKIFED